MVVISMTTRSLASKFLNGTKNEKKREATTVVTFGQSQLNGNEPSVEEVLGPGSRSRLVEVLVERCDPRAALLDLKADHRDADDREHSSSRRAS